MIYIIFLLQLMVDFTVLWLLIKVFLGWKSKKWWKSKSKNNNDDISISDEFDNLSKNNKVKDNFKYIYKILGKNTDSQSILNALKDKKLEQLFFIRNNIEDSINSGINFEKDIYKLLGILSTFILGVYTTLYMGFYSNVKSSLISHMITNVHKIDSESIRQLNNISEVFKSEYIFEDITQDVFLKACLVLIFFVVLRYTGENRYEVDSRIPVLLEQVKLAIEIKKEKYKEKYQENLKKQEAFEKRQKEFQQKQIAKIQAENKAKQDKRNAKLDKQLERFYLDNVSQETKESLRHATSLFVSAGSSLSDLFLPSKHVDTRNNELLRAITTQNYILIKQNDNIEKQNDKIISILEDISKKLDK